MNLIAPQGNNQAGDRDDNADDGEQDLCPLAEEPGRLHVNEPFLLSREQSDYGRLYDRDQGHIGIRGDGDGS